MKLYRHFMACLMLVGLLAPATVRGTEPKPVLLGSATQKSMKLELWDDTGDQPWRVREPRQLRMTVTNVGDKTVLLPEFNKANHEGQLMALSTHLVVGLPKDVEMILGSGISGTPYSLGPGPHAFFPLGSQLSFSQVIAITPVAPGTLLVDALFGNGLSSRCENRAKQVGVGPKGEALCIMDRVEIPVLNAWVGGLGCTRRIPIVVEAGDKVAEEERELRKLLDNPQADPAAQREAFEQFCKPTDWASWKFAAEAMERVDWPAVRETATQRLEALIPLGLPVVDWDKFVKRLNKSPRWEQFRTTSIPLLANPIMDQSPRIVLLHSTDAQTRTALQLLRKWTSDPDETLRQKARAAIDALEKQQPPSDR